MDRLCYLDATPSHLDAKISLASKFIFLRLIPRAFSWASSGMAMEPSQIEDDVLMGLIICPQLTLDYLNRNSSHLLIGFTLTATEVLVTH